MPNHPLIKAAMAGLLMLLPTAGHSQDSLLLRDYDFVEQGDAWLTSRNGAALTRFGRPNLSAAEVSLTRGHGGLTDYSGSPQSTTGQAAISSLYRISQRTVVSGSMSYESFSGKEMGGSAFINSYHLPFEIDEDSLTNLGRKHLDRYQLSGGVGADLYRGFSIGGRFGYTAANYAKYKDLRHKNKLMDMEMTVGLYAPLFGRLTAGAGYYYHRCTESVNFSTYSHEEKVYKSLLNYGPFFGETEQFGMYGFTDYSRELPMVDDCNGIVVELGMDAGPFTLTNELLAAYRKGYYGSKSPYTITFSHHHSHVYEYKGSLQYTGHGNRHHLTVSIKAENLENYFSNYREVTNEAGATHYDYYTPLKTANKVWVEGSAAYTAYWGIHGDLPTWTLKARLDWLHRRQTAYLYPYFRRQHLDNKVWSLELGHHHQLRHGLLSLTGTFRFGEGQGAPYEDHTFTTPSDKQASPATMDAWLYREHQWLTAAQYSVGGSVRYAFIFPHTRLSTYVKGSAQHRKANETNEWSLGRDRSTLSIALGCWF